MRLVTLGFFLLGIGLKWAGFPAISMLPMFAGFYLLGRIDSAPADGAKHG